MAGWTRKKKVTPRRTSVRPEVAFEAPKYRRNRTMTDRSTVPEVTERARINHVRALRKKVGFILLVFMLVAIITALLISQFTGTAQITNTQTSLRKSLDTAAYQEVFSNYYAKHPIERFRFLTNYDRLTAAFHESTPEVESLQPAGIGGIGVSRYELVMRRPVASWVVDSQRYYVDASGVTFTKNYYDEPGVSVVDNSGAEVAQGAAIASSRLLSFVGRVVALSTDQGIKVTSIEIPTQSMRHVQLKGEGIPVVRMTIDRDVDIQVNDMAEAIKYLKKTKKTPSYIDVRVEGKAFYK